jgi:tRNA threonylcarbamoyladenosine biosynthesis protein TsaB
VLVLGIDTATQTGGVALLDEYALRGEYLLNVSATHSERLLGSIERLLLDAHCPKEDIDGIAVSIGPGSFTGLRIGVTVAKTLAWVWKCPVVGVSTLAALARQGFGAQLICPMIDARRKNVYAAVYSQDYQTIRKPQYISVDSLVKFFQEQQKTVVFLGDGVLKYGSILKEQLADLAVLATVPNCLLRPASVAYLGLESVRQGHRDDPSVLRPVYLRQSEAERKCPSGM